MSTAIEITSVASKLKSRIQVIRNEVHTTMQFLRDPANDLSDMREREQLAKWLDKALKTCDEIAE